MEEIRSGDMVLLRSGTHAEGTFAERFARELLGGTTFQADVARDQTRTDPRVRRNSVRAADHRHPHPSLPLAAATRQPSDQ